MGRSAEEDFFYFTDCSFLLAPPALVGIFCFNSMIPSSGYCYSGAGCLTFLGPVSHNLGCVGLTNSVCHQFVITTCSVRRTSFLSASSGNLFFPWCCFYCSPTVSSKIVSETVYTGREDTPLHPWTTVCVNKQNKILIQHKSIASSTTDPTSLYPLHFMHCTALTDETHKKSKY